MGMTEAHAAMYQSFANPDPHSMGLLKLLKEIYPQFAKRIFQNNKTMELLVMYGMNPMDMLDYPICGRCETLAAWAGYTKSGVHQCKCFADGCGATTNNPVTMREWMLDELRHKAPPDIAEIAEVAVDVTAMYMMKMALNEVAKASGKVPQEEKMGILMPDGTERKV